MPGADSSNAELYSVMEKVFAETPDPIPAGPSAHRWTTERWTGDTLENQQETTESQEIVKGRQVADLIRIDLQAAGDVNSEFSFSTYDRWIASLLQADTQELANVPGTDDVSVAPDTPAAGQATYTNQVAWANQPNEGDFVIISGHADPLNDGRFAVISSTPTTVVVANANAVVATNNNNVTVDIRRGYPEWQPQRALAAASITVAVAVSGNDATYTDSGGWDNTPAIGDVVSISGFTEAGNNGIFRVNAVSGNDITVINVNAVNESAGDSVTITAEEYIENGSTFSSYSMQREYADLAGTSENDGRDGAAARFLGMSVDSFNLEVTAGALLSGGFTFLGKRETAGARIDHDNDTDPNPGLGNAVMTSIDNVEKIIMGGVEYKATQVTIAYLNNGRNRPEIGTLGAVDIGSGTIGLSGTIQAYYATAVEYNKFLAFTPTSLQIWFKDAVGNRYIFDMPMVKYSTGTRQAESQNTDVIANLGYTAFQDAAETGKTLRITRLPAA